KPFEESDLYCDTLSSNNITSVSVIFILDNFDLFTLHHRQTLLYNLFDISQTKKAPIAVIGLTCTLDSVESLEKRVKSRFSHRIIQIKYPDNLELFIKICRSGLTIDYEPSSKLSLKEKELLFIKNWNKHVDDLFEEGNVTYKLVKTIFMTSKDVREFYSRCIIPITSLSMPTLQEDIFLSQDIFHLSNKIELLNGISLLQFSLLICAAKINARDTNTLNFNMVYKEYRNLVTKSVSSSVYSIVKNTSIRLWERNVLLDAWEKLCDLNFLHPCGNIIPKHLGILEREFRMYFVEITLIDLISYMDKVKTIPTILRKWSKEFVKFIDCHKRFFFILYFYFLFFELKQVNIRRSNYTDAYSRIKAASLSGSCTVLIFVALDVDALCACKMLSTLMKHDFISHKIQPISGYQDLMDINQMVVLNSESFLILLNCGALIDLYQYLTPQDHVSIYVIDSHRPWNLDNAFSNSNIFVFDDGDIEEKLYEERKAYEALLEMGDLDSEEDSEDSDDDNNNSIIDEKKDLYENKNLEKEPSKKQRESLSLDDNQDDLESQKDSDGQEKFEDSTQLSSIHSIEHDSQKKKRKEYSKYQKIISDYYDSGTWFGECISSQVYSLISDMGKEDNELLWLAIIGQVYSLISDMGKEDNELLWLAIIGLTNQEMHRRMSYGKYLQLYSLFKDEVDRLNPPPISDTENIKRTNGKTANDSSIRAKEEFRFMLFRHWSLYDAMLHSFYLGTKLKIWSEYGKKRLHKLFAKMGISLYQCRQVYTHMDMDLKKSLREKLDKFAPLYGLNDLVFPSFIRTFGFKCTLSAIMGLVLENKKDNGKQEKSMRDIWLNYFYDAFDALDNIDALCSSLKVAMELQKAIVRTGTSLIDKHAIKHLRAFRIAVLKEGPDLDIFTHPFALSKLALWIADAINEQEREQGKTRHLPFVIASFNKHTDAYLLLGTSVSTSSPSDNISDDVSCGKNRFGLIFSQLARATSARLRMDTFDAYCIEVFKSDLVGFLELLSTKAML
ncbi:hypothetical protein PORY_002051, partial [Pneumocystis oryctolagi]